MGRKPSIVESRSQQLFPVLTEAEVHRLRRFGILQQYLAGVTVIVPGKPSLGLLFVLSGTVAVTLHAASRDAQQTATYGPGAFVGEAPDLAGRPSVTTVKALDPVSALVVSAEGLHAVLREEPAVGERIVRALILRNLGLVDLEGPLILGPQSNPGVHRFQSLLKDRGLVSQTLDVETTLRAQTLIQQLKFEDSELPLVLCRNGRLLTNPKEREFALAAEIDQPDIP